MVSNKTIHRALRTHTTLHFHHVPKLYFGFNVGPFALAEIGPSCVFPGNIVPLLGNMIFCGKKCPHGGSGGMEKKQEKKQPTKEELLKSVVSLLLYC